MPEVNYSYYEIHTGDIWNYERAVFLEGKSTEDIARKVLDKIQLVICERAKPNFGIENYNRGNAQYRRYYEKRVNTFINSIGNLEELYSIDYFFFKDQLYEYNHSIIMKPGDRDFEFWFALKLRQYDGNIFYIANFLTYQLHQNFRGNRPEFSNFLKLIIRQYQAALLTPRVTDTVDEWITSNAKTVQTNNVDSPGDKEEQKSNNIPPEPLQKNNSKKAHLSNKTERKMEGELHALLLKKLADHPNYFQDNINDFTTVFVRLKNEQFIHQTTSLENFKAIFQNKRIAPENRIIWIGSVKELQWGIKYLVYASKQVYDLKKDIWLVTAQCFLHKNGTEFTDTQLRNASGKRVERKELLESILSKL